MSMKDEGDSKTSKAIVAIVLSLFIGAIFSGYIKNSQMQVMAHPDETVSMEYELNDEEATEVVVGSKENYNLLESLTGLTSAYRISIAGRNMGYIPVNEKVNDILAAITNIHIDKLNISKKDIVSTDIRCDIGAEKVIISMPEVRTSKELAKEIYNSEIKDKNEFNIDIKAQETVQKEVKPDTVTIEDDSLFIGETIEENGEAGVKEIFQEVIYNNGEIKNTTTICETIIVEPKNNVIKKGTKNPYDYGVAFLKNPTKSLYLTSGYGSRWNSFHKGIDIAGNLGDDVFAAIEGEVTYAQFNDGGYGNLIMVRHDNEMITYYAHLNDIKVSVGDKVSKGDIIGAIGSTGNSTGPHLHFELRVKGEPVNPVTYIIQ